ncbi:hypothetical protein OFP26_39190, partial [Escherichia coli]|nr:hypothetical protein [Escherichia coli]
PDPKYEAYLIEGNDPRGIDSGFLVKSASVKVVGVQQIGKDERFLNPVTKNNDILNDRPPLVLEAEILSGPANSSLSVTVVV